MTNGVRETGAVLNGRPCRGGDGRIGDKLVTATVQRGQQGDSESKRTGIVVGWRVDCGPKHSRSWALPIFALFTSEMKRVESENVGGPRVRQCLADFCVYYVR